MDRIQAFFDSFFSWLPNLIGAIVILIVAYIVARLVAGLIRRVAARMNVDHHVDNSVVGDYKRGMAPRLSITHLIASVVFWFVFGTGILLAIGTLQIPLLDSAIGTVVGYLPNVLAALLILVVGVAIAGAVGAAASRLAGDTTLGRLVGTAVPIVVVAVAIAMALVQLQISPPIVIATYVIVLGSVGLGLALAFGLGGRAVASDLLRSAYDKTAESMPQCAKRPSSSRTAPAWRCSRRRTRYRSRRRLRRWTSRSAALPDQRVQPGGRPPTARRAGRRPSNWSAQHGILGAGRRGWQEEECSCA